VSLAIVDAQGDAIRELEGPGTAGLHEVIWDLRLPPPYEPVLEPQQRFSGAPSGPRVLPGSYTVQLTVVDDGSSYSTELQVRLDPRVDISRDDLVARQHALLDMYALAKPLYDATGALRGLTQQIAEVQGLLRDAEDAPESLSEEATAISAALGELNRELNQINRSARGGGSIENSTTRPTADQLWQIEQAWEQVPDLITRVNEIITNRMPAFYAQLDENGIRPDPGEAVAIPVRPGR
jgi:hypothetical protein